MEAGEKHSDLAYVLMLAPRGFANGWMRHVRRISKKESKTDIWGSYN